MDIRDNLSKLKAGLWGVFKTKPEAKPVKTPETIKPIIHGIQSLRQMTHGELVAIKARFNEQVIQAMKNRDVQFFDSLDDEDRVMVDLSGFNAKKHGITDLSGLNLSKIRFENVDMQGVDFREANLSNTTMLVSVNFAGANFTKANLENLSIGFSKRTISNFEGAIFKEASLKSAFISGEVNMKKADFSDADLEGAHFADHITFKESVTDLSNANFTAANLRNAELKFKQHGNGVVFKKADLSFANLVQIGPFENIDFSESKFIASQFSFKGRPFPDEANLNFSGADLRLAGLNMGPVTDAQFDNATVFRTSFKWPRLRIIDARFVNQHQGRYFEKIDTSRQMQGVDFSGQRLASCSNLAGKPGFDPCALANSKEVANVDFSGCNFDGASLDHLNFMNCSFDSSLMMQSDLSGASFDDKCNFEKANIDRATIAKTKISPSLLQETTTAKKMGGQAFRSWFIRESSKE